MNKTLIAAFTALALSTGVAMADGPEPTFDYQAAKILAARQAQSAVVEAGGSDASNSHWHFGPVHETTTPGYPTVGGD